MTNIAVVLANDNVQGLLLACRMVDARSYARVRCSIGGPLCYLLEENSCLKIEDGYGRLREVKTRVLRRGAVSTLEEEEASGTDVLWLCDWRDTDSAWYALRECAYVFQTSKATDSKTVAMWLVEVCREDCQIVSLQSGLHNCRELRRVFGRVVVATTASDAPLPVNQRRSSMERGESVSSAMTAEEEEEIASAAAPASPTPKPRISLLASHSASVSSQKQTQIPVQQDVEEVRKPGVNILAGVLGFGAALFRKTPTTSETHVLLSHHGAICVERMSKKNAIQTLPCVLLLERTGFAVKYRPAEEMNNWLWGDLVWRTMETYAAGLAPTSPTLSLYALLRANPKHRLVMAALIQEALDVLQEEQNVDLMDSVTSPFGLSFRHAILLLRLPNAVFAPALHLVLRANFFLEHAVRNEDAAYCSGNVHFHRVMAPFLNGEVVRVGFEADVSTPVNRAVIEALTRPPSQAAACSIEQEVDLPKLFPLQSVVQAASLFILLLAVAIHVLVFILDVTFNW